MRTLPLYELQVIGSLYQHVYEVSTIPMQNAYLLFFPVMKLDTIPSMVFIQLSLMYHKQWLGG